MGVGSKNSSDFLYFKRDWIEWGFINNSHFIYSKRVWMERGVEQQQLFYLFKEGLDASEGRITAATHNF